jgi:Tol biopolymer transport system component
MPDLTSMLKRAERAVSRVPVPEGGFERLQSRRDRKRRNQRIAAGVVGIALFVVPVALIAVQTSRDGTQTPAAPGRSVSEVPKGDYLIDVNTGEKTPLPDAFTRSRAEQGTLSPSGYAVSPDGSLLAYVRDGDEGTNQIFIAGIDGTDVRQVTHDPMGAFEPAWSPDGTMIAYAGSATKAGSRGLFVVDVASGEPTRLTEKGLVEGPSFTPDGTKVVYTHAIVPPVLKTVPVTGGRSTPLFPLGADLAGAENGSLSPDGSLVTFLEQGPGNAGGKRWVANADGTERRLLLPCLTDPPSGTWSPDGSRIVCLAAGDVRVVDIVTGDVTRVDAGGSGAIWLDDHTLLVDVYGGS